MMTDPGASCNKGHHHHHHHHHHHAYHDHTLDHPSDVDRIYMDYNATTPCEPEVVQAISDALLEAWGNPSSGYAAGVKARQIINQARADVARMVGGNTEDIIFTSGGTEANNLVFHTAVEHFNRSCREEELSVGGRRPLNGAPDIPHIITSSVEHDSVTLIANHLQKEGRADVTFVPVSKVTAQVEVEAVMAAVRPSTCLISVMMANNETGVLMPIRELGQKVRALNKQRHQYPRILLHTDAAQAIGKVPVDARDLEVDYLTIVGHKFYGPRIGALYVNGPGSSAPLYPLLFGGGQERNFRPGTENTAMIAGLGKAAELVNSNLPGYRSHMLSTRLHMEQRLKAVFGDSKLRFNSLFPGSECLPNTCNVSILGPGLEGRKVLSSCKRLLASVGAACHTNRGDGPSHILLSCGVPPEVASNAVRLSVGRNTSREEVEQAVQDLRAAVTTLELASMLE
ncbi:selenocysteine lyase [Osmerus mordax]|uniref:selenocysteine lyase n=1 Tax=Osmerus mordax TaxID=8014 RepID=UPI00350EE850